MCTASWIHHEAGYELFFNRDEKRTRLPAISPALVEREGVRFLSPTDGDAGGTWIAANEFGLTICLLNGANLTGSSEGSPNSPLSRGLLIPDLISSRSILMARERLDAINLAAFSPFTIIVLQPGQAALLFEWNVIQKTVQIHAARHSMVTSSSFDSEAVRAARHREYRLRTASAGVDEDLLTAFHASHLPTRSAYSTCMHRPDAQTVSFSRITVSPQGTDFFYSPAPPCEQTLRSRLFLPRQVPSNFRASQE